MQCTDCGGMTHPGSCIEFELDIWFWQKLGDDYGEWVHDNHCTYFEFIEANQIPLEELTHVHKMCERETEFTMGGGAATLFLIKPSRPTIH